MHRSCSAEKTLTAKSIDARLDDVKSDSVTSVAKSSAAEKPLILSNGLAVCILSSNLLLHNMQRFAPVSLFEELRVLWGTSYTDMGNLLGAHLITYALCQIPMGLLADRIDNKRLMTIGGILSLVGTVLFALSPNLTVAMIARVGLGLSSSFLYIPTVRYVVATFNREKRASTMGWVEFGPVSEPLWHLLCFHSRWNCSA